MSDQSNVNSSAAVPEKGKGKALDQHPDVSMDEDEDSSDSGVEEEPLDEEAEESDPDTMEEIDTDNILNDGRRTRGKVVDFAAANKDAGNDLDDDEDEDDDFCDEEDGMEE